MGEIFIDQISSNIVDKDYLEKFYNNGVFEITFLFKSDFSNAKYLRDYLFIIFDILGVNSTRKNRFILILDELNNNAIEYGSVEGGLNIFRFNGKKDGNNLILNLEVEDEGNGKTPKKAIEMEKLRKERLENGFNNHTSIRGRGLFMIITKLVDKLYFKDSSKGGLIVGVDKVLEIDEQKK